MSQKKSDMTGKDKLLLAGAAAAILLIIGISALMIFSKQKQKEQAAQEAAQESARIASSKAASRKRLPKFSSYSKPNTASISKSDAEASIADAVKAAFEAMHQLELISGQSADVSSLPKETRDKVRSAFTSDQVFQDFNDNVNVSVDGGSTTYGDAGTGMHVVKRPTPKTPYYADKLEINLTDTSSTEYTFDVAVTYHPKGFEKLTQKLTVQVDRSVGKVSRVSGK